MRWLSLPTGLAAIHVLANVVWIGSLLAAALVASRASLMADAAEVGAIARRVYLRLAVPAFAVSFTAGVARFAINAAAFAHMPWMHAKLTFALGVIILHHMIGARTRRIAGGAARAGRGLPLLAAGTFACAAGAVFLAVYQTLP